MGKDVKFSRLSKLKYDTLQTLTRIPRAGRWGKMWEVDPPVQ